MRDLSSSELQEVYDLVVIILRRGDDLARLRWKTKPAESVQNRMVTTITSETGSSHEWIETPDPTWLDEMVAEILSQIDTEFIQRLETLYIVTPYWTDNSPLVYLLRSYLSDSIRDAGDSEAPFTGFKIELLNDAWAGLLPWIFSTPLELRTIFPILRLAFDGESFGLHGDQLKFVLPTIEERNDLLRQLEGPIPAGESYPVPGDRLSWVGQCRGWIEGSLSIEFTHGSWLAPQTTFNHPRPRDFEEALKILGYWKAQVHFLIVPKRPYFQPLSLRLAGKDLYILEGSLRPVPTPQWQLGNYGTSGKVRMLLDEPGIAFLRQYGRVIDQIAENDSVAVALRRFLRAIHRGPFDDVILDSVIAIEVLQSQGRSTKLQFHLTLAWLLGRGSLERKFISRVAKRLYEIRSAIMHEGGKSANFEKAIEYFHPPPRGGDRKPRSLQQKNLIAQERAKLVAVKLVRLIVLRLFQWDGQTWKILGAGNLKEQINDLRLGIPLSSGSNPIFDRQISGGIAELSDLALEGRILLGEEE